VYGEAARRAPKNSGLIFVREHPITHGQSLVLRGRVAPGRNVATGFRDPPASSDSATAADFRTQGEVVLIDNVLG